MSVRVEYITAKVGRFLERYTPPRDLGQQAVEDELGAIIRAVDRAAPQNGYDSWWLRFEDVLGESLKTRAWPTVGDVARAAARMPAGMKAGRPAETDLDEREGWKRQQLRYWLGETMPEGMSRPGIGAHLVTRERLLAVGRKPGEIDAIIAYANDPRNGGVDPDLSDRDREDNALRDMHAAGTA